MGGKIKITLELTEEEARATVAAIKSACDFSIDYYMFSPGKDYNSGNTRRNDVLQRAAVRVAIGLNEKLNPPEGGDIL